MSVSALKLVLVLLLDIKVETRVAAIADLQSYSLCDLLVPEDLPLSCKNRLELRAFVVGYFHGGPAAPSCLCSRNRYCHSRFLSSQDTFATQASGQRLYVVPLQSQYGGHCFSSMAGGVKKRKACRN